MGIGQMQRKKTKYVCSPTNGEMLAVIQDGDAEDAERALVAAQYARANGLYHRESEQTLFAISSD